MENYHEQNFLERLDKSGKYTDALACHLQDIGHFSIVRKATKQEDLDGIDFWVNYSGKKGLYPIQFKVRQDGRLDCPMAWWQPLSGTDEPEGTYNRRGRDYRALTNKMVKFYYWAVRDKNNKYYSTIHTITSTKLGNLVKLLEEEWNAFEFQTGDKFFGKNYFTKQNVDIWKAKSHRSKIVFRDDNDSQIWYKKNAGESPKLLAYFSYKYASRSIVLDPVKALEIENKIKGDGHELVA
jgi:hypothetical protein